jgi:ribose transport system substrate-binding protein
MSSSQYLALAAVACGVALGACGGDGSSEASAGSPSAPAAATSNGRTIGILQLVQADEASARASTAVEKQAAALGYKTTLIDANFDPSKELAGMDTLINQKVAAIITVSADSELLKSKFLAAQAAKIPVVAINGGSAQPGIDATLDVPEQQGGVKLARAFFDAVKAQTGDKPAKVVEMVLPEASPCRRRGKGFDSVAPSYPNIKVVKYHIDGANAVAAANNYTAQYLQGNKDLAGILSCWDVPALGALTAVDAAKPAKFTIMGVNGTSNAVAALQSRKPYLAGTLAFALAEAGSKAAKMADAIVTKGPSAIADKAQQIRTAIFTPANVPPAPGIELPQWLPDGWSQDYWK